MFSSQIAAQRDEKEIINNPEMFFEKEYYFGRYDSDNISKLTRNCKPYLLTSEAEIGGSRRGVFDRVKTVSTVTERDCAGHFGFKDSRRKNLRIPLLHLSRIMNITAQIAALHGVEKTNGNRSKLPVLVGGKKVRARNQNLMAPPASVVAIATDFKHNKGNFSARTFARAEGEEYAEIEELFFKFVPIADFSNRKSGVISEISRDKLEREGYSFGKDMYCSDIEEHIFERKPFHQLDRAILCKSDAGLKLIMIAKIMEEECDGQLKIDGKSTISLIDYSKLMALTAELLASLVTRQRFDGMLVVPIAVKVDNVTTPNLCLFSPPATAVIEANITLDNLNNPSMSRRGKKQFWVDNASVRIADVVVASMEKIAYALIPERTFF
jgi:hypothetical protein